MLDKRVIKHMFNIHILKTCLTNVFHICLTHLSYCKYICAHFSCVDVSVVKQNFRSQTKSIIIQCMFFFRLKSMPVIFS